MTDKTNLTLEIAREWLKHRTNTLLIKYTSIDNDAADELASCDDDDIELYLDGLTSLSDQAAQSLSRCQGELSFNGLASISDRFAEAFSKQKNGQLRLNGLTSISDSAAEAFSKYVGGYLSFAGLTSLTDPAGVALSKSVGSLYLSGLTSVSDTVADALSMHHGIVILDGLTSLTHPVLASKLAQRDDELNLPRLSELSDAAATAISKTEARLILGVLKPKLNFDLALKLSTQPQWEDEYMSVLTSLSASEAAKLSQYPRELWLTGLPFLSEEAAVELVNFRGCLDLSGLTFLSDTAAKVLSKHKGTLTVSDAISTQIRAHFLRRYLGERGNETSSAEGKSEAAELKHGKLYECKIHSESGVEELDVVQLAIDVTTNRRFLLLGAKHHYAKAPELVRGLINMSFFHLDTEVDFGSGGSDNRLTSAIMEFILDKNGLLHNRSDDCYLSDFKEINVI